MITEQQYQRLMNEYAKSGVLDTAAMKAGMHRETGSKYLQAGQGPQPEKRRGRRRPDPLTTIWPEAERLLGDAPELEAKALFEHVLARTNAPQAQQALRTFPTASPQLAAAAWSAQGGVFCASARAGCQFAARLDPRRGVGGDDRRPEVGAAALPRGLALLPLAVGGAVPVGIDVVDATRLAGGTLDAGWRARQVADRPQFDRDACVAAHDGQTRLQRRVSGVVRSPRPRTVHHQSVVPA